MLFLLNRWFFYICLHRKQVNWWCWIQRRCFWWKSPRLVQQDTKVKLAPFLLPVLIKRWTRIAACIFKGEQCSRKAGYVLGARIHGQTEKIEHKVCLSPCRWLRCTKVGTWGNMSPPHLSATPPCLGPHNCVFICPHKTAILQPSGVMEETFKEREQDQGILRFGGQVWRWGEGWPGCPTWMTECQTRGEGLCAAQLLRGIRCSHSVVTRELVTGDVMRSDYRRVHRLAAKGWPIIPQSLKECFVKSGWKRGEKEMEKTKERGEYKRCVGELNNTWFDMKSLLLPPRRSSARKDVREASRETPTTRKQDMPCSGFKEQTD